MYISISYLIKAEATTEFNFCYWKWRI